MDAENGPAADDSFMPFCVICKDGIEDPGDRKLINSRWFHKQRCYGGHLWMTRWAQRNGHGDNASFFELYYFEAYCYIMLDVIALADDLGDVEKVPHRTYIQYPGALPPHWLAPPGRWYYIIFSSAGRGIYTAPPPERVGGPGAGAPLVTGDTVYRAGAEHRSAAGRSNAGSRLKRWPSLPTCSNRPELGIWVF